MTFRPWDEQFYPEGVAGWMTKLDVAPGGGIAIDPAFYVDFGHRRPHQVRLEGGDASSDSYQGGNTYQICTGGYAPVHHWNPTSCNGSVQDFYPQGWHGWVQTGGGCC